MFIVVTGGSGSGKSAYAEDTAVSLTEGERFYIATMQCFDEESKIRVQRHRRMRKDKGFTTIERYTSLKTLELPVFGENLPEADVTNDRIKAPVAVLLECMSNLAANEMFAPEGAGDAALEELKEGILHLLRQCDHLVVVTNEIFSDGLQYDAAVREYRQLLAQMNIWMAARADLVKEVVCGIGITRKKGESI